MNPHVHHGRSRVVRLHGRGHGASRSHSPIWPASSSATTPTATITCSPSPAGTRRGWRCGCRSRRACAYADWRELGARRFRLRHAALLHPEGRERGPAHPRLHRRQAGARGRRRRDPEGQGGVTANIPARFQDFRVDRCRTPSKAAIDARIATPRGRTRHACARRTRSRSCGRSSTRRDFGAGRNVRFGDLDGDGAARHADRPEHPARARRRLRRTSVASPPSRSTARCSGRPAGPTRATACSPTTRHSRSTTSTATAATKSCWSRTSSCRSWTAGPASCKRSAWMPDMAAPDAQGAPVRAATAATRSPSSISPADKRRREILVKDRYRNFWVFDNDLKLLWQGEGQTGHYPYPLDIDGDGRDEIVDRLRALGPRRQAALDATTRSCATTPTASSIGNFSGDPKAAPRVYACGSDEGFLMFDTQRQTPEARAHRPRPEPRRRQVPPGRARPAVHDRQLLAQPRHRHAVRSRRQHAGAGRAHPHAAARCCR